MNKEIFMLFNFQENQYLDVLKKLDYQMTDEQLANHLNGKEEV